MHLTTTSSYKIQYLSGFKSKGVVFKWFYYSLDHLSLTKVRMCVVEVKFFNLSYIYVYIWELSAALSLDIFPFLLTRWHTPFEKKVFKIFSYACRCHFYKFGRHTSMTIFYLPLK